MKKVGIRRKKRTIIEVIPEPGNFRFWIRTQEVLFDHGLGSLMLGRERKVIEIVKELIQEL